ncbi:hypothetical protein L484_005368 [Morus notabilis]|uniref:Peptidase S8/S53 domain-containing protein n=1 Tax=Morus notabilis TaxID=981085 RepID=W9RVD5_9ROSA|nr:hypothetical protein L484_005368 [Morus notabilis]
MEVTRPQLRRAERLGMSVSISAGAPVSSYSLDVIAIGSFHAIKKGILTVTAAGNFGPGRAIMAGTAPWLLTVAASTIDRKFVSTLVLKNGQRFEGGLINAFDLNGTLFSLIWGGDAANFSANAVPEISESCLYRSDLDAMEPTATILVAESRKDVSAPYVAYFSARGPSVNFPDILKPDIIAPGVGILGAWSGVAPPSMDYEDKRRVPYYIKSGTSMAAAHVTGAAAHVKAAHPHWLSNLHS